MARVKLQDVMDKMDEGFKKVNDRLEKHDAQFKFAADMFFKIEDQLNGIDQKFDLKFDKTLEGMDKIVKELEVIRLENSLAKSKDDEQDKNIADLQGHMREVRFKLGFSAS